MSSPGSTPDSSPGSVYRHPQLRKVSDLCEEKIAGAYTCPLSCLPPKLATTRGLIGVTTKKMLRAEANATHSTLGARGSIFLSRGASG